MDSEAEHLLSLAALRDYKVWKVKLTQQCLKPALFLVASRGRLLWVQRCLIVLKCSPRGFSATASQVSMWR